MWTAVRNLKKAMCQTVIFWLPNVTNKMYFNYNTLMKACPLRSHHEAFSSCPVIFFLVPFTVFLKNYIIVSIRSTCSHPYKFLKKAKHIYSLKFTKFILITYQKVIYPCGYIQCMQVCQQVNIMTNNSTV